MSILLENKYKLWSWLLSNFLNSCRCISLQFIFCNLLVNEYLVYEFLLKLDAQINTYFSIITHFHVYDFFPLANQFFPVALIPESSWLCRLVCAEAARHLIVLTALFWSSVSLALLIVHQLCLKEFLCIIFITRAPDVQNLLYKCRGVTAPYV